LKQVFFDEKLMIYVKVAVIGNSSLDIHYMAKNEQDVIVITGRSSIVQIGRATGKGIHWTDREKALFAN
jgi:acyl-CoA thioester hydrolase